MRRRHRSQFGLRLSVPPAPVAEQQVDPLGYPRPQFRRPEWFSLNGRWEFAIDVDVQWSIAEVPFGSTIVVPFAPETQASGIGDLGLYKAAWYRLRFKAPALENSERV